MTFYRWTDIAPDFSAEQHARIDRMKQEALAECEAYRLADPDYAAEHDEWVAEYLTECDAGEASRESPLGEEHQLAG